MKKPSANKKKGWQSVSVKEFLGLSDTEEELVELRLLVAEKFPTAEVINYSDTGIEFLLKSADENLNTNLNKIFKLGNCKFSLTERTKDWKIRILLLC